MRVFTNESIYDKNTEQWVDYWAIDNAPVDSETFFQEVEKEENIIEEPEDDCACSQDDSCEQCNCSECPGCDNLECCEENRDCKDENLEEICECPICQAEQEVQDLECHCSECNEDYMKDFIGECLERVFNGCPDCAIESVVKLAFKCKELGRQSVKQEVREVLED